MSYRAFLIKLIWRRPTLPPREAAVPSALRGLTTVFGMGTGVTLLQASPKLII